MDTGSALSCSPHSNGHAADPLGSFSVGTSNGGSALNPAAVEFNPAELHQPRLDPAAPEFVPFTDPQSVGFTAPSNGNSLKDGTFTNPFEDSMMDFGGSKPAQDGFLSMNASPGGDGGHMRPDETSERHISAESDDEMEKEVSLDSAPTGPSADVMEYFGATRAEDVTAGGEDLPREEPSPDELDAKADRPETHLFDDGSHPAEVAAYPDTSAIDSTDEHREYSEREVSDAEAPQSVNPFAVEGGNPFSYGSTVMKAESVDGHSGDESDSHENQPDALSHSGGGGTAETGSVQQIENAVTDFRISSSDEEADLHGRPADNKDLVDAIGDNELDIPAIRVQSSSVDVESFEIIGDDDVKAAREYSSEDELCAPQDNQRVHMEEPTDRTARAEKLEEEVSSQVEVGVSPTSVSPEVMRKQEIDFVSKLDRENQQQLDEHISDNGHQTTSSVVDRDGYLNNEISADRKESHSDIENPMGQVSVDAHELHHDIKDYMPESTGFCNETLGKSEVDFCQKDTEFELKNSEVLPSEKSDYFTSDLDMPSSGEAHVHMGQTESPVPSQNEADEYAAEAEPTPQVVSETVDEYNTEYHDIAEQAEDVEDNISCNPDAVNPPIADVQIQYPVDVLSQDMAENETAAMDPPHQTVAGLDESNEVINSMGSDEDGLDTKKIRASGDALLGDEPPEDAALSSQDRLMGLELTERSNDVELHADDSVLKYAPDDMTEFHGKSEDFNTVVQPEEVDMVNTLTQFASIEDITQPMDAHATDFQQEESTSLDQNTLEHEQIGEVGIPSYEHGDEITPALSENHFETTMDTLESSQIPTEEDEVECSRFQTEEDEVECSSEVKPIGEVGTTLDEYSEEVTPVRSENRFETTMDTLECSRFPVEDDEVECSSEAKPIGYLEASACEHGEGMTPLRSEDQFEFTMDTLEHSALPAEDVEHLPETINRTDDYFQEQTEQNHEHQSYSNGHNDIAACVEARKPMEAQKDVSVTETKKVEDDLHELSDVNPRISEFNEPSQVIEDSYRARLSGHEDDKETENAGETFQQPDHFQQRIEEDRSKSPPVHQSDEPSHRIGDQIRLSEIEGDIETEHTGEGLQSERQSAHIKEPETDPEPALLDVIEKVTDDVSAAAEVSPPVDPIASNELLQASFHEDMQAFSAHVNESNMPGIVTTDNLKQLVIEADVETLPISEDITSAADEGLSTGPSKSADIAVLSGEAISDDVPMPSNISYSELVYTEPSADEPSASLDLKPEESPEPVDQSSAADELIPSDTVAENGGVFEQSSAGSWAAQSSPPAPVEPEVVEPISPDAGSVQTSFAGNWEAHAKDITSPTAASSDEPTAIVSDSAISGLQSIAGAAVAGEAGDVNASSTADQEVAEASGVSVKPLTSATEDSPKKEDLKAVGKATPKGVKNVTKRPLPGKGATAKTVPAKPTAKSIGTSRPMSSRPTTASTTTSNRLKTDGKTAAPSKLGVPRTSRLAASAGALKPDVKSATSRVSTFRDRTASPAKRSPPQRSLTSPSTTRHSQSPPKPGTSAAAKSSTPGRSAGSGLSGARALKTNGLKTDSPPKDIIGGKTARSPRPAASSVVSKQRAQAPTASTQRSPKPRPPSASRLNTLSSRPAAAKTAAKSAGTTGGEAKPASLNRTTTAKSPPKLAGRTGLSNGGAAARQIHSTGAAARHGTKPQPSASANAVAAARAAASKGLASKTRTTGRPTATAATKPAAPKPPKAVGRPAVTARVNGNAELNGHGPAEGGHAEQLNGGIEGAIGHSNGIEEGVTEQPTVESVM